MIDYGPVRQMLDNYQCRNNQERREALKEIVQEIALLGLSRSGFFNHGAFYGGTALRIFHGLERFSEDLDFSLTSPDPGFLLDGWLPAVRDELASYGFSMEVTSRQKTVETAIQSAFIKGGTLMHLVRITSTTPPVPGVPPGEKLKIKIEVDTDPPPGASFEVRYRLQPIPYPVRLYDLPSLFAGKLHAVLCRNWKGRVNGRDFFDHVWFLTRGIPVNAAHLESRMRQTSHWSGVRAMDRGTIVGLLHERFSNVDFD